MNDWNVADWATLTTILLCIGIIIGFWLGQSV